MTENKSTAQEKEKEYPRTAIEKEYDEFLKTIVKGSEREQKLINYGIQKFLHFGIDCMNDNQFIYTFITQIQIRPVSDIPTLGISLNKQTGCVTMYYNPIFIAFFATKGKEYLQFFIMHEILHISFSFFSRCENVEDLIGKLKDKFSEQAIFRLKNIAHDLAINCIIKQDLLASVDNEALIGCFPTMGFFKNFPNFLPMEEYFRRLAMNKEIQENMSGKYWVIDEHGFLNDIEGLSDAERLILKNEIREITQKAISAQKSHGNETHQYLKKLEALIGPPKINAEEVLRFFVERTISVYRKPSIRKINKKVPYVLPGKNKTKSSKLALCVDQSGSVDDQLLVKVLKVCERFCEETHVDLIPFDCGDIIEANIRHYTPGTRFVYERVQQGGTDFNKPTNYVNDNGTYDGMIIFTDLEAPRPTGCSVERVWITSERCSNADIESSGDLLLKFEDPPQAIPDN